MKVVFNLCICGYFTKLSSHFPQFRNFEKLQEDIAVKRLNMRISVNVAIKQGFYFHINNNY
jgi:hypothetical protein